MTARSLAIAAGMAMAVMGNLGHATAEEILTAPTLVGATLAPAAGSPTAFVAPEPGVQILLEKPIDFGAEAVDSTAPWYGARLGAESRPVEVDAISLIKRDGKGDDDKGPFFTYAGLGLGKVKFSMDLNNGDLELAKEKQYRRTQLFLGMGYGFAPGTSLALEYRLATGSDPLFEKDDGIAALGSNSKFNNHNVLLNLRLGF